MLLLILLSLGCSDYELDKLEDQVQAPEEVDPEPLLRLEPSAIDFGEVQPGEQLSEVVTLANDGDGDLHLYQVELRDSFGAFSLTDPGSATVEPGEERELVITLAPELQRGELEATLEVGSDDPTQPWAEVALSGSVPLPELVLEPTHHDFGELDVGDTASVRLTVSNQGGSWGQVRAETWASSSPAELVLDVGSGAPFVLDPGEQRVLTASYTPTDAGRDEASLVLSTDDPVNSELSATLEGSGRVSEYAVEIMLTADDEWRAWVDSTEHTAANSAGWDHYDTLSLTLESGSHVIAVQASDTARVISGFIAVVWVEGAVWTITGDGTWVMQGSTPATGWQDVGFDDSAWSTAIPCADPSTWGTYWPAYFYVQGAQWVWNSSNCKALGQTWLRYELELP